MIIYFYRLDWFEKSLRIDIQILQYGQKVNILFRFAQTFIICHNNNISIIPFLNSVYRLRHFGERNRILLLPYRKEVISPSLESNATDERFSLFITLSQMWCNFSVWQQDSSLNKKFSCSFFTGSRSLSCCL